MQIEDGLNVMEHKALHIQRVFRGKQGRRWHQDTRQTAVHGAQAPAGELPIEVRGTARLGAHLPLKPDCTPIG